MPDLTNDPDYCVRLHAAYKRAVSHDYTEERLVLERAVAWGRMAMRAEAARMGRGESISEAEEGITAPSLSVETHGTMTNAS